MSRVDDDSITGPDGPHDADLHRLRRCWAWWSSWGSSCSCGATEARPATAGRQPLRKILPVISYAAPAYAVMAVPMSFLIPSVVVKNGRKQIARGTWTPPVQGTGTFPQGPFGNTVRLAAVY